MYIPHGKFEKWQACGNDFVLTSTDIPERPNDHSPDEGRPSPFRIGVIPPTPKRKAVMRVCDRHFGVGADGVIFINPSGTADAEITIINADGTEAEMCGNGIRCVGQYLARELGRDKVTVDTLAGTKELLIDGLDVHVDMGDVVLRWSKPMYLPGDGPDPTNPQKIYDSNFVDVGNPHCVLFVEDYKEGEIEHYGYMIEHMEDVFPCRTNVEFVRLMSKKRIRVRVWERGCGRTLACGTGACASAYAAFKRGFVNDVVTVELEGGEVEVRMQGDKVIMVGMAELVYRGEFLEEVLTGA